jgi:2'-phosphotransferase
MKEANNMQETPASQPESAQPTNGDQNDATKPRTKRPPRRREDESPDVKISKTLSYILRHGAAKEGLKLRPDGFVRVEDLVRTTSAA